MALSFTKEDVLLIAPELSAETDDDKWARIIEDTLLQVQDSVYGTKGKMVASYLAAHLMTLAQEGEGGSNTASVVSETVGNVSRTYAQPTGGSTGAQGEYQSTSYGARYLQLVRLFSPRFLAT